MKANQPKNIWCFLFGWGKEGDKKMNRQEFVKSFAQKVGLPYTTAYDLTSNFIETINEALTTDGCLRLVDLFTIQVVKSGKKQARDIRTNKIIKLAPHKKLKITIGKSLYDKLNNEEGE